VAGAVGDALLAAGREVERPDLVMAVSRLDVEDDALAVRRERGVKSLAGAVGETLESRSIDADPVEVVAPLHVGAVDEEAAVRRPGGKII
jgi:hypothetical protein